MLLANKLATCRNHRLGWCHRLALALWWHASVLATVQAVADSVSAALAQEVSSKPGRWGLYVTEKRPVRQDDVRKISEASKSVKPGLVMLKVREQPAGGPLNDFQATGFVFSKTRRLVATAAHIADWFSQGCPLFAIVDGTARAYRVERAWLHPGLVRELDYGLLVRSPDFRDGRIVDSTGDVAVLQLAAEGPELPAELELASDEELRKLEGKAVGFVGYPLKCGTSWPTESRPAKCTFCCCTIAAMSDSTLDRDLSIPPEKRQFLLYDYVLGPGASGCPIFLANAHVVGIATNGSEQIEPDGRLADYGPRIDCLRELLAYHNLGDANGARLKATIPRDQWAPDPRLPDFRRAAHLVGEAVASRRLGKFDESRKKCDEALLLAPTYGGALMHRSAARLHEVGARWTDLVPAERLQITELAIADADRCCNLIGYLNDPWLIYAQLLNYRGCLTSSRQDFEDAKRAIETLFEATPPYQPLSKGERPFALNLRAQCHHFLGDLEVAERDYTQSISLSPHQPRWYENRARYWVDRGKSELADADRKRAKDLRKDPSQANSEEPPPSPPMPGSDH